MIDRPKTSADWRRTVGELAARRDGAEARAAEIDGRRGEFVLAAQLGDEAARAKLAEYDRRLADARRDAGDLRLAVEEAEAALGEAEEREAEEVRRRELARAARLEGEAYEVAERIDGAIARVTEDAGRIRLLLSEAAALRRTTSPHTVAGRIEFAVRSAYWKAGVKVGDHVQNIHKRSLVEGLSTFLGVARPDDRSAA